MHKTAPDVQHFGLLLFAGHGMIKDGVQCFVLNQFNKIVGFYKLDAVESHIRGISKQCKNGYFVAAFACCREIWLEEKHANCVGAKSLEEAIKKIELIAQ